MFRLKGGHMGKHMCHIMCTITPLLERAIDRLIFTPRIALKIWSSPFCALLQLQHSAHNTVSKCDPIFPRVHIK